jgi:hypothetical protein
LLRSANLLPSQACCGQAQWGGNPDEPPECCGQTSDPEAELLAAIATIESAMAALKALRSFEYQRGHCIHQSSMAERCMCTACIESRADAALAAFGPAPPATDAPEDGQSLQDAMREYVGTPIRRIPKDATPPAGGGDAELADTLDAIADDTRVHSLNGEQHGALRASAALIRRLASASPVAAGGGDDSQDSDLLGGELTPERIEAIAAAVNAAWSKRGLFVRQNRCQAAAHALRRLASSPARVGDGVSLIAAERQRQVSVEGWTPEHDAAHVDRDLAVAAACYARFASLSDIRRNSPGSIERVLQDWPWDEAWFKPSDRIRDLTKAGALIAAEIDRLQRAAAPAPETQG